MSDARGRRKEEFATNCREQKKRFAKKSQRLAFPPVCEPSPPVAKDPAGAPHGLGPNLLVSSPPLADRAY